MHKLHECVTKEINDIVEHGISTANLGILGELVDIRKDIEEMWHWHVVDDNCFVEVTSEHDNGHAGVGSIDELISSIKSIDTKLKTTDSPELVSKLKKEAKELYECAEKIKHTYETVKFDADLTMMFKNMYK